MRWLLGRAAGTCDACGAELERGAAWCGSCGYRVDAGRSAEGAPVSVAPADADAGPHDQPPLARRALAAVVVLALIALAVAWQLRSPPPAPLLGHLGQSTGMSATGPPPSGLRLAWAHEPPGVAEGWSSGWPLEVVADGDRVRVANLVVDVQAGLVVGVTPALWQVTGVERTLVDGRELLVVDSLSGAVRSRAMLSEDVPDGPFWEAHRGPGASLLRHDEQSVLVADDGSVVAEVDGHFLSYIDRALDEPVAFPVRRIGRLIENELSAPLQLVRADTGEVIIDLPGSETRVADVRGDLVMVATTDATRDLYGSPPAADDIVWTVQLIDGRTGEQRAQLTAISRAAPRLVGAFSDGTAIVSTRLGNEYPLLAVTPEGDISTIAQFEWRSYDFGSGLVIDESALVTAAMSGDVLAVINGDEVVGLDRTGQRVWTLDAPGTTGMRGGDGYLALFKDDGTAIRLVHASDGDAVATVHPAEEEWMVGHVVGIPSGVIEGRVGISRSGHYLTPRQGPLVETTWLDLGTGEAVTVEEVFTAFAGDEERVGLDWVFHGIVTDEQGVPEPVFSRTQPQTRFELLDPGEGFRTYELPLDATDGYFEGAPAFGVSSVGATADWFAAWREGIHDPADMATIVLDRATGTSTTVKGVRGLALLDDLLLGEEIDDRFAVTALVAVDPATGQERWRAQPPGIFPAEEPLLVDDALIIDTGAARVTARSTRDGTEQWTHPGDAELSGDTVLGPSHVVVATTSGEVVALDRRDGTVAWRTEVGTPVASLTGAGDHVLVGTHDGLVIHLDGRGREVQRIAVGTGAVHEVAALGETVVVVVDQRIVGLRADGNGITRDDEVELP